MKLWSTIRHVKETGNEICKDLTVIRLLIPKADPPTVDPATQLVRMTLTRGTQSNITHKEIVYMI